MPGPGRATRRGIRKYSKQDGNVFPKVLAFISILEIKVAKETSQHLPLTRFQIQHRLPWSLHSVASSRFVTFGII
jgi:hypothetical protein